MADKLEIDAAAVGVLRGSLKLDSFFPEMSTKDVVAHFPKSGLYLYGEKEYVLHQDEPGRDVFVVISGLVTITQMGDRAGSKLGVLEKGALFGEIALAKDGKRTASAIATKESRIFRVAYPDVEALVNEKPPVGEHLKALAEQRLHEN